MADRAMVTTWGAVVRGREDRALENFNDVLGLYGRMQQEGRIEGFDVTLLLPNSTIAGFIQLTGSAAQIAAVREDAEFQRLLTVGSLIVEDLCVIEGYVNEGVAKQTAQFQDAASAVPQTA